MYKLIFNELFRISRLQFTRLLEEIKPTWPLQVRNYARMSSPHGGSRAKDSAQSSIILLLVPLWGSRHAAANLSSMYHRHCFSRASSVVRDTACDGVRRLPPAVHKHGVWRL
jgi:hypothetical protein